MTHFPNYNNKSLCGGVSVCVWRNNLHWGRSMPQHIARRQTHQWPMLVSQAAILLCHTKREEEISAHVGWLPNIASTCLQWVSSSLAPLGCSQTDVVLLFSLRHSSLYSLFLSIKYWFFCFVFLFSLWLNNLKIFFLICTFPYCIPEVIRSQQCFQISTNKEGHIIFRKFLNPVVFFKYSLH